MHLGSIVKNAHKRQKVKKVKFKRHSDQKTDGWLDKLVVESRVGDYEVLS